MKYCEKNVHIRIGILHWYCQLIVLTGFIMLMIAETFTYFQQGHVAVDE